MSIKYKKQLIKFLDHSTTGLITLNRLIFSNLNFTGVNSTFIPQKKNNNCIKSNYEQKEKVYKIVNNADDVTSDVKNENNISIDNDTIDDIFLIKTDKLKFVGKHSKIPVSSFSRAISFGMLGASLITNSLTKMAIDKVGLSGGSSRGTNSSSSSESIDINKKNPKNFSSYLISESNAEKLSRTLCKMRGAALKLGQILSTFEDLIIPEPIRMALERARSEADIMPNSQLIKILKSEYSKNWKIKFAEFNEEPFAAASIGQVHDAKLLTNQRVAIKIQYPGVAESIDSDLQNLKRLFEYFKIFPKGLYVNDLILNLGNELKMECNYIKEAEKQRLFKQLLSDDQFFYVPNVISDYSTKLILCTEFIEGVNVDELGTYPQHIRDLVGSKVLELTLRELFEFRFMQTDPNPANFYYDQSNNKLNLIDFGAAREFSEDFVDKYMTIVHAAACNDKSTIVKVSKDIGFLTGMESNIMIDSHTQATLAIGEPFNITNQEDYFDFGNQNLTRRIYKLIPTMLKHRLKSPPTEIYSLHRKLSGAYLICIRLRSRVKSRRLFFDIYDKFYKSKESLEILRKGNREM